MRHSIACSVAAASVALVVAAACGGKSDNAGSGDGGDDGTLHDGPNATEDTSVDSSTFPDSSTDARGDESSPTEADGSTRDGGNTVDAEGDEDHSDATYDDASWCPYYADATSVLTCYRDGAAWCCPNTGQVTPQCPPGTQMGAPCEYDGAGCFTCSPPSGSTCECTAPITGPVDGGTEWLCVGAGYPCSP
jgi:hypothetical protein